MPSTIPFMRAQNPDQLGTQPPFINDFAKYVKQYTATCPSKEESNNNPTTTIQDLLQRVPENSRDEFITQHLSTPAESSFTPPSPQFTQVQTASAAGDLATVKAILQKWKGNMESFNSSLTPAMKTGHYAVASYLLRRGVPIVATDFKLAMEQRSYPFMELYLTHGYDLNLCDSSFQYSSTPLANALDDEEMTQWLLDHGADPNAERVVRGSKMGETPLSISMWHTAFKTIRLLLERAGPNAIRDGHLLWYATSRQLPDQMEVLEYLLKNGGASDLTRLMYDNHPEAARQADWGLGCGTPLHTAARHGNLDAVNLFMAWGADPAVRSSTTLTTSVGKLAIDEARIQLELKPTHGDYQVVIDYLSSLSSHPRAPSIATSRSLERL
ncbi:MAG: hypothetical protein Q9219_006074 [cf. Caloplaca sp. 3 TL-2023]